MISGGISCHRCESIDSFCIEFNKIFSQTEAIEKFSTHQVNFLKKLEKIAIQFNIIIEWNQSRCGTSEWIYVS